MERPRPELRRLRRDGLPLPGARGTVRSFHHAGLPSVVDHADAVYRLTYVETDKRNREFFARYPGDEATAWSIARHLADVEETLPTGERLTPGRFRQIGGVLGRSYGLERLHFLLEDAFRTKRGAAACGPNSWRGSAQRSR